MNSQDKITEACIEMQAVLAKIKAHYKVSDDRPDLELIREVSVAEIIGRRALGGISVEQKN